MASSRHDPDRKVPFSNAGVMLPNYAYGGSPVVLGGFWFDEATTAEPTLPGAVAFHIDCVEYSGVEEEGPTRTS